MAETLRKLPVDGTDMAILRDSAKAGSGKFTSQQATMEAVAKGLGLHPKTVVARIKRMQEGGGMGSRFTVMPQPSVVGIAYGRFFATLPMSGRTESLLEDLYALGVLNVMDTLEGWEIAVGAPDDARLDAAAERIRARLNSEPVRWSLQSTRDWPALPAIEFDETDLAILGELVVNGRVSMDDVAAKLGLNARTVHRRHERMRDAEAFRLYPFGDAMFTGLAFRYVGIDLPPPGEARVKTEAELERIFPNSFTRNVLSHRVLYLLYGDEQGELEAQIEQAGRVAGATVAFSRQFRRFIVNPHYPRQAMDLLRNRTGPGARGPAAEGALP